MNLIRRRPGAQISPNPSKEPSRRRHSVPPLPIFCAGLLSEDRWMMRSSSIITTFLYGLPHLSDCAFAAKIVAFNGNSAAALGRVSQMGQNPSELSSVREFPAHLEQPAP
jgi:hypothetical protein